MADSDKSVSILVRLINRFSQPAKEISDSMKNVRKETEAGFGGTRGVIQGINTAAAGLKTTLATLGVAASVAGLVAGLRAAINQVDELKELADSTGVSVEKLSKIKFGANLVGLNQQAFVTGIRTFADKIAEAEDGSSAAALTFDALGVSVKNADGTLRNIDDILPEIAEGFQGTADGVDKVKVAMDLFGGRSGLGFVRLLNEGSEGLQEFARQAQEAGQVFTTKDAVAADRFNDALTALAETVKGSLFNAFKAIIDPLTKFIEGAAIGVRVTGEFVKQGLLLGRLGARKVGGFLGITSEDAAGDKKIVDEIAATSRRLNDIFSNPEKTLAAASAATDAVKAQRDQEEAAKGTLTALLAAAKARQVERDREKQAFAAAQREEIAELKRAETERQRIIESGREKIAAAREADLEKSIDGLRTLEAERIAAIEEESERVGRAAEEKQQLILLVEEETAEKIKEINQKTFEEILEFQRTKIEGQIALIEQSGGAAVRQLEAQQAALPEDDIEGRAAIQSKILTEEFETRRKVLELRLETAKLDEREAGTAAERLAAQTEQKLIQIDLVELTEEQAEATSALTREYERARIESNKYLTEFESGVTSAGESLTKNLLEGFRKGTLDAKAVFMDFLESIISGIEDLLAQAIVQDFKNLFFNGGTSGQQGQGLFTGGGLFKGLFPNSPLLTQAQIEAQAGFVGPPSSLAGSGGVFDDMGGIPLAPETEGMFSKFLGGMGKIMGVSPSGTASASSGFLGGLGGILGGIGIGTAVGGAAGGNQGGAAMAAIVGSIIGLLLFGPAGAMIAGGLAGTMGGFFSEGGKIGHGGGRRGVGDRVPIVADAREWIIRPEAVEHYGDHFMAMVNDMMLPRGAMARAFAPPRVYPVHGFAAGGPVGRGSGGGEGVQVQPILVASDDQAYQFTKGGMNGFLRALKERGYVIPRR